MFLFTDGRDLIGVEKSQDIKYMKFLRFSLRIITAWPEQELEGHESKYHIYKKCYTFFIELMCLLPGIFYLQMNLKELTFFELGHTYITVLMNTVAVTRLVNIFLKKYSDTVGYFVKVMHLFNYKNTTKHVKKTKLLVHKMSHFLTICLNIEMVFAILMFNGTPLIKNFISGNFNGNRSQNVTYDQAVYYALPFDFQHNFSGYFVVFSFNWYISYICTSCICIFDLLLSLMVIHVWGHMKILIDNLNHFPRPELEKGSNKYYAMYSKKEIKIIHQLLRENIIHHYIIKEFVAKMSDTFGPLLLIYLCFQQVTGCVILLECSQMETAALVRYGPMSLIFFQEVVQISIVFELLGTVGETLSDTVYNIPWECMDKCNRQIMCVFLKECQKSMSIKAMDMVSVGVRTMAAIIKTSFSYCIMLRTFADLK